MFISAQSANQLVEVDPKTDTIVRRIPVPTKGAHQLRLAK
jgi:hypothetical protein